MSGTLRSATGSQAVTAERQESIHQALSFIGVFLLIFAFIALFVGSFVIFNTFSIIVAQRLRELALLRAVGASRRQVITSVLGESLVIGVVASGAGVITGIGLAVVLKAGLAALGFALHATGLVVSARTVLVGLAAGAVTVFLGVAALGPFVARPVSRLLGAPLAARSTAGKLSQQNAMRNPSRTAATVAALMVGVALVSTSGSPGAGWPT